ncbi:hypothetical protein IW492_17350 [Enterococcus sp. BWB1-3]|uniref:hypothetical protein n=1 Tax=Enterococcus sp. BWB1-3 TaxID=2787713 RepID=UPI001924BDCB|nr:hypothetical protein [Enterococcus sp. BWB1-3]MBL1230993.1 hypothetical protein [Enterococcus sp. BWB1-3]
MKDISTIRNYELGFCLKIRKSLLQQEIPLLINELETCIIGNNLTKRGNTISGIHEKSSDYNAGKVDIEIIQPVLFQENIALSASIEIIENWYLKSSLHYTHTGNPQNLQNSANNLKNYILENGLNPITPIFNLPLVIPTSLKDIDTSVYELIIGIDE